MNKRKGISSGEVIGIFIVILLGASLLPGALATWGTATATNGTLEDMSAEFKTMWNLVPLGVALTIFASIVMVAVKRLD